MDRREALRIMNSATHEIDSALSDGTLTPRRAYFPLDPAWRLWIPSIPTNFVRSILSGISLRPWQAWPLSESRETIALFDRASNRRRWPLRIEAFERNDTSQLRDQHVIALARGREPFAVVASTVFLVLAIIFAAKRGWEDQEKVYLVRNAATLLLAFLLGRAMFIALIESNLGWGIDRYMRLISPLLPGITVFASLSIAATARQLFASRTGKIVHLFSQLQSESAMR
jgi:hypothetical protein